MGADGQAVGVAVTKRLEALELPVPVSVNVDFDTPLNEALEHPRTDWSVGAINTATAAARRGSDARLPARNAARPGRVVMA